MALVRMSNQLRSEIINRAGREFDLRIRAQLEALPLYKCGDMIYEKVFGAYAPQFLGVPKPFLHWTDNFPLSSVVVRQKDELQDLISIGQADKRAANIQLRLSKKRPFVESFFSDGPKVSDKLVEDGRAHRLLAYVADPDTDADDAQLVASLTEWRNTMNAINEQRAAYVSGVKQVVEGYNTLAPALKAWPLLWDLLPHSVQEKHKEITPKRGAADKAELGVDVDRLTSIATVNKLVKQ